MKISVLGFLAFVMISLVGYGFYPLFVDTYETKSKLNQLAMKSEEHSLMVGAFKECKRKLFSDSVKECQLFALNYIKELKIDNANTIFAELVSVYSAAPKKEE